MDIKRCPNCGAPTVTEGHLRHPDGYTLDALKGARFEPARMRYFSFRWKKGVTLTDGFDCCLACGHVWATLTPEQLRSYISRHGNKYAKQSLGPFEKSPSGQELA